MSKFAAIDFAVRQQLLHDGKAPLSDYKERMGVKPQNAPANVKYLEYDATELMMFLFRVSNTLKLDAPPLTFEWSSLDVEKCLKMTIANLQEYISEATK